jgi:hypothetical protein
MPRSTNTSSKPSRPVRQPLRCWGAIGALSAILLNILLPPVLPVGVRASDPFGFSAAICDGRGAGAATLDAAGTSAPAPSPAGGDHECCAACLLPFAHALIPPQAVAALAAAPLRIGRIGGKGDAAMRQSLQPVFRSRAPPTTA